MAARAGQQPAEPLRVALDDVWERSYPSILERVHRIEDAAAALDGGPCAEERLALGRAEAHRLAGVLGTFGLPRGSELAGGLEQVFETADRGPACQEAPGLAAELRAHVEAAAPH